MQGNKAANIYGVVKTAFGVFGDLYSAWQQGQMYEEQARVYKVNALEEVDANRKGVQIRENARKLADLYGYQGMDEYLQTGSKRLQNIEEQLAENNASDLLDRDIAFEQSQAVEENLSNMMSQNALDAMKAEARIRAAAAETGTSGGTTAMAANDAKYNQMFDNAVLIGRANAQKLQVNRRLTYKRLANKHANQNVASKIMNVYGTRSAEAAFETAKASGMGTIPGYLKSGYVSKDVVTPETPHSFVGDILKAVNTAFDHDLDDAIYQYFKNKKEEDKKKKLKDDDGKLY